jgi:hypothetical protein
MWEQSVSLSLASHSLDLSTLASRSCPLTPPPPGCASLSGRPLEGLAFWWSCMVFSWWTLGGFMVCSNTLMWLDLTWLDLMWLDLTWLDLYVV